MLLFFADDVTCEPMAGSNVLLKETEMAKNPLCCLSIHCGRRATLGPWQDMGGCVNRTIIAIGCYCHGESSSTYEHAKEQGWTTPNS